MEKKQSSVEWLILEIKKRRYVGDFVPYSLFEQAKAMHKEEIMEAYRYSRAHWSKEDGNPEQYFTKTFGGQDNE